MGPIVALYWTHEFASNRVYLRIWTWHSGPWIVPRRGLRRIVANRFGRHSMMNVD
jgi:hypothetical protein